MEAVAWSEAERYLTAHGRFGVTSGLHRMRALLGELDHPERSIPHIVHVGGTNGKGSVTAYLATILTAGGWRVLRYTSPHLRHYRERLAIDGQPVTEETLARTLLEVVRPAAERVMRRLGEPPTVFELLTAAAYLSARDERVDCLVQEVGLGGRLDPTNVVAAPQLVVLTNVSLDHTDRLGETVTAIAGEKAQILKPGCLAVTAAAGEALQIFTEQAAALGVRLWRVAADAGDYRWTVLRRSLDGSEFELHAPDGRRQRLRTRIPGTYQVENAALAASAIDLWLVRGAGDPATAQRWQKALAEGLVRTHWPARMDFRPGVPPVLIDGAHNPAAMKALRTAVDDLFPARERVLLTAVTGGRDPLQVFAPWLAPGTRVRAWAVVPLGEAGAARTTEMAQALAAVTKAEVRAWPSVAAGWAWARRQALTASGGQPALLVVCGSLYLAGEVLSLLDEAEPSSGCSPGC